MISIARLLKAVALTASLLAGGLAGAAPSVTYSGGVAVGIQDLVVAGTTYDVSFVFGRYNTIFATNDPTFLGDETTANEAADALLTVLDAEPAAVIGNSANCCGMLWVPFADDFQGDTNLYEATQTGYQDGAGATWQRFASFADQKSSSRQERNWAFAVFTANTVPEPGSMALVGLALGVVGFSRRRAS